jgi:hypothetical protein
MQAFGRTSEHLVEREEEQLRDTHSVDCHEGSYRSSRTPSKVDGGQRGRETVQRTEVQEAPKTIDERSRDSFLRFRDEWVRNRAREIRLAGSMSFTSCSEDTASIRALNEFYRERFFDRFKAEYRDEKEFELATMQVSREDGSFHKNVATAEKLRMCRIVCREKGPRVLMETCRRLAKCRV